MQSNSNINVGARLETILNNFNNFFNKLGVKSKPKELSEYLSISAKKVMKEFETSKESSTLNSLKSFVRWISLGTAAKATLNGVYGETLTFMADEKLQSLAGEELIKAIEEALKTGEQRTSFSYNKDLIPSSVQKQF
jgi:hypothetical protein